MKHLLCLFLLALTSAAHATDALMLDVDGNAHVPGDVNAGDAVLSGSYYMAPNIVGQPNGAVYWESTPQAADVASLGVAGDSGSYFWFAWMNGFPTSGPLLGAAEWFRLYQADRTATFDLAGIRLAGWTNLREISTPSAPPADTARLFARDNGSGKTQLCVIFPTGAVQVLATQP